MFSRRLILPRYLFQEVWPLYLAGLFLLVTLLILDALATAAGFALRNQTSPLLLSGYLLSYLPRVLHRALPLAIPFAVLIALGRLARDSELKVAFSAGIRPISLLWALLLIGVAITALSFFNNAYLRPWVNPTFENSQYQVFNQTQRPRFENKYVRTDARSGGLFYAGSVQQQDSRSAVLSGVMVRQDGVTYTALTGTWTDGGAQGGTWTLLEPWVYTRADQTPVQKPTLSFPFSESFSSVVTSALDQPLPQLYAALERGDWQGQRLRAAQLEFHRMFADSLSPIFFVFAAGGLGLLLRNRSWAFISVILMIFLFYVVFTAMPRLVDFDAVQPWLGAWMPNLLLMVFASTLLRRLW